MTEGKAEGVPFFFTGRCLVGRVGAVAPDTAPPLGTQPGLPERKSGTDKRGGTKVARDGPLSARKEHGTETRGGSTAPPQSSQASRTEPESHANPTAQPPPRQRRPGKAGPRQVGGGAAAGWRRGLGKGSLPAA